MQLEPHIETVQVFRMGIYYSFKYMVILTIVKVRKTKNSSTKYRMFIIR